MDSLYQLGHAYYNGWGVALDEAMGKSYYDRAAKQGDERAMVKLAQLMLAGMGGPADVDGALALLESTSADYANSEAAYELGSSPHSPNPHFNRLPLSHIQSVVSVCTGIFYRNEGKYNDIVRAANNYALAAERGHAEAQYELGNPRHATCNYDDWHSLVLAHSAYLSVWVGSREIG